MTDNPIRSWSWRSDETNATHVNTSVQEVDFVAESTMLDYKIRHSGYFVGIEAREERVEEWDRPPEESRVVDGLVHDDGGGLVTVLFSLSVVVRRCDDLLVDVHSVLENTCRVVRL